MTGGVEGAAGAGPAESFIGAALAGAAPIEAGACPGPCGMYPRIPGAFWPQFGPVQGAGKSSQVSHWAQPTTPAATTAATNSKLIRDIEGILSLE